MINDVPQPEEGVRHPYFIEEDRTPLDMLFDDEGFPVILFTPVPLQRRRKHGWDAIRQQAFIAMLCRVPSVSHAARAVGMSARSAYKLLDKAEAEEFSKAWDMALDHGMTRLRGSSIARSLEGGDYVPVFRKGRMVRVEFRPNDRLAIALLGGKNRDIDHYRRFAQQRWRQRQEWNAHDAEKAAEKAEREARHKAYWDEMNAIMNAPKPKAEPRIRSLDW